MARARLDADHVRPRADIRRLKRGDRLERVVRSHAVVGVGGGDEDRGVGLAGPDVVMRLVQ